MKTIFLTLVAGLFAVLAYQPAAYADVASLRGANALTKDAQMFDKKREQTVEGGFKRSWKLQPPGIPHKISKERINLQENTCMRCHSEETFKKEKAPRIGESHYVDASGKVMKEMNARRYFCNLCHTTQVKAAPLVENTY